MNINQRLYQNKANFLKRAILKKNIFNMTSKFGSDLFIDRHLGLRDNDERIMLNKLGFNNIDEFINQVIPEDIQIKGKSSEILPQGCSEIEALNELEDIANKNTKMRSLIGLVIMTITCLK